jgi:P27 family predicted phage terminase small subunit
MGARGPKTLPANVHLLRGNLSKKSASQLRDGVAPSVEIPNCPRHLKGAALKEWKRITVELEKLGLISQIDRAALAMYCTAWGRHVDAEEELHRQGAAGLVDTTPNGFRIQGVYLNISNKAMEQCKSFLAEFGMSPSSRSRVTPGDLTPDLFEGTEHSKPSIGSLIK